MSDEGSNASKLVVETPCEHGLLHPHDIAAPPDRLHIGNLYCPLAGFSNKCPHPGHCDGGSRTDPEPADLLAAVRAGVESGTIKGEVRPCGYCDGRGGWPSAVGEWVTHKACWGTGQLLVIPVSDGGSET